MNIVKKVVDIELNGEKMVAVLDMQSIVLFKKMTKKPFLASLDDMNKKGMDEEVVLNLMACTIRKEENDKPIGKELFEKYDLMGLLLNLTEPIMSLIADSMPIAKPQQGGKTGKK